MQPEQSSSNSTATASSAFTTNESSLNPGLVTETNASTGLSTSVDDVLRRLRGVHPSMAGNEEFLHALRGHKTVYSQAEKLSYPRLEGSRVSSGAVDSIE